MVNKIIQWILTTGSSLGVSSTFHVYRQLIAGRLRIDELLLHQILSFIQQAIAMDSQMNSNSI